MFVFQSMGAWERGYTVFLFWKPICQHAAQDHATLVHVKCKKSNIVLGNYNLLGIAFENFS